MKRNKKVKMSGMAMFPAALALGATAAFGGVNLVGDPDVNRAPLSEEYRIFGSAKQGRLTSFEEEWTWNKCAKFELVEFGVDAKGVTNVNTGIIVGGDAKRPGFPCREKTKYRFSFELKGDAPQIIIVQSSWDAKGKKIEQKATSMQTVRPLPDAWTAYRGELETPAGAARTALIFQIWGTSPRWAAVCTPGYHFLLDKVNIEEVSIGKSIWPSRVIVVPEDGSVVTASDFSSLLVSKEAAHYPSAMTVRATDDALVFGFDFGNGKVKHSNDGAVVADNVWRDNHVELFFETPEKGADLVQLVLGSHGGRWMNGAEQNLSSWSGTASISENGWKGEVKVPWRTIGFKSKPSKGTVIRFNVMRERIVCLGEEKFDSRIATRKGSWRVFDDSVFSFTETEIDNRERLGVMIIGADPKYGDDPSAWWYETEKAKEDARLAKLMREPFVVAQVPFHTDPAIPYLPQELFDPQPVLKVRAAVNERTALPVAIANMRDAMEEYRVVLNSGSWFPSAAHETAEPRRGLMREDGRLVGPDSITVRRGVRFRDGDAEGHGMRYDVLAKIGEASSVPVSPKEAGLLWIQFDCHGVEPGVYKGELLVTPLASGHRLGKMKLKGASDRRRIPQVFDDSKAIPVELEVLPFELPEPSAMALNGYRTAYRPYQAEFMAKYDYAYYNVTPWFFDVKFNADGSIREAMTRSFLKPHLEMLNANVKRIGDNPRAMVCYSCYHVFKDFHVKNNKPKIEVGSEAYWRAWGEWLRHVDRTMREAGFDNDDYCAEIFDEPNLKEYSVEEMTRILAEAKKAVPKMQMLSTTGVPFFEAVHKYLDFWIFSRASLEVKERQSWPGKMMAHGGKTSVYSCGVIMRQDLYRYYRMLPWCAAGAGAKFVSIYQFVDQFPATALREGTYGGVAYDTGYEMLPSIRLENLYKGMTDVRYLRLLEDVAKARRGEALADEALKFARLSLRELPTRYPHDSSKADAFRDKCIDYLLKLSK